MTIDRFELALILRYLLQEQLDQKLEQRQARETGICQVRRELYAQCFDELIRQVGVIVQKLDSKIET